MCQYGQGVVRGLLDGVETQALKAFAVWLPMLGGDTAELAQAESDSLADPRLEHSWDADHVLGNFFAKTLGLKSVAWDVYLLYASGTTWDPETPPAPAFWMHQLPMVTGADPNQLLHAGRFSRELLHLLGTDTADVAADLALALHASGLSAVKRSRARHPLADTP
ncbi:MAG: hypothetical protein ACE5I7_10765 [Candidatus Binatia bacterium]